MKFSTLIGQSRVLVVRPTIVVGPKVIFVQPRLAEDSYYRTRGYRTVIFLVYLIVVR